ncbi:MAG: hypothetical protein QW412_02275 [Candidatus Aenigmatarchaeota archaeon]
MKELSKVLFVGLVFVAFLVVLLVQRYAFAAEEVTVKAQPGNTAPNVASVEAPAETVSPGTEFKVTAYVSDFNGREDITEVNISCWGSGGEEGGSNWDSLTLLNNSGYITWEAIDEDTWRINATFNSSVPSWGHKSINGSWTCKVGVKDSSGSSASGSDTMSVDTLAGIILGASSCQFDSGAPGTNGNQWECSNHRNNTVVHDGNTNIYVTIEATSLIGKTDGNWTIGYDKMTWNQTVGEVPTNEDESYPEFTASPANFITNWGRGTYPNPSATNSTVWIDYPTPLLLQEYEGTITFTAGVG